MRQFRGVEFTNIRNICLTLLYRFHRRDRDRSRDRERSRDRNRDRSRDRNRDRSRDRDSRSHRHRDRDARRRSPSRERGGSRHSSARPERSRTPRSRSRDRSSRRDRSGSANSPSQEHSSRSSAASAATASSNAASNAGGHYPTYRQERDAIKAEQLRRMGIQYGVANASAGCDGNSINLAAAYAVSQELLRQQQQQQLQQPQPAVVGALRPYQSTLHHIVVPRAPIPSLLSLGVTNPNAPPGAEASSKPLLPPGLVVPFAAAAAAAVAGVSHKPPLLANAPAPLCGAIAAAASSLLALPLLPPTTAVSGLAAAPGANSLTNFTSPSILASARYTEQMQKRKLLWGNKKMPVAAAAAAATSDATAAGPSGSSGSSSNGSASSTAAPASTASAPLTTNKWEETRFSQDTDGKVATKFLRLMGMKDATPKASELAAGQPSSSSSSAPDTITKQNELLSTMEHQYEVARQVTHTMRGMGLGFGSQPRQF